MGACCSCHRGHIHHTFAFVEDHNHNHHRHQYNDHRYHNNDVEVKKDVYNIGDEGISIKGDHGAHIRLQGSSKFVSMFSQKGRKGVNQDSMTVWENFNGEKDMFFCGVFDGHGPSGHKVSQYVRDLLPSKLSNAKESSTDDDDDNDEQNPFFSSWKPKILDSYAIMDEELENDAQIDSYTSGSTSVAVLKQGEHLVVANLGDSRAVLCTRDDKNTLVAEQITVDLKPNVPGELKRILSNQGRVKAMEKEPSVYRIWMPDQDCPGLAMARAFGDFCLKDFGVISTPEVFYRKLTSKDEFIVLATDGVWDVLSNEEVVAVVDSASKRSMAAKLLVERAVQTWKYKYPSAKCDDCAVVCLFFKRQKPKLIKSYSEKTQLSLNYAQLGPHDPSTKNDDGLDTVLNWNLEDSPERPETNRRVRKRIKRNFESVES